MNNKEKITKLENILEYIIMHNAPIINQLNRSDLYSHIDSIILLQRTISDLRHKQHLKDQDIYKGDID